MAKANVLVVSNQIKYFYFQKTSSLSTGGLKRMDFDLYDAANELYKLAENEQYGTIKFLARVKVARTPLSLLCKLAFYGVQDPNIDKNSLVIRLQKELRNDLHILIKSPLAFDRKVLAVLFSMNYSFTENCVHLAKNVLKLVR